MLLRDPRRRPWWDERHPAAALCLMALCVTLVSEMLCRRSPAAGLFFVFTAPAAFLANALIVLLTLAPGLLLRRPAFWNTVASAVWLSLGAANCVVLGYRITPISAIDLKMLKSVWGIIGLYLSPAAIVLVILALAAILLLFVRVWLRSERVRPRLRRGLALLLGTALALCAALPLCLRTGVLSDSFLSLGAAYRAYGFVYSFTCSLVDRGVDKPDDYSEERVDGAVDDITEEPAPDPDPAAEDERPNVIFVQLESYFDPVRLTALNYSGDPIARFRALERTCSHGWLTVPSIGAGTANTEFEVLTGMSLQYFGAGEYPYETVLQHTACESLCYNLAARGYESHAIHNHNGAFYDRNRVFASLGFDTFCSREYMLDVTENPIGWACDDILTGEITKALSSTAARDFVYTISVQAHGKYPREELPGADYWENYGFGDENERWAWGYYLTQLEATDRFVGALTDTLENWLEPCVVVFFGDHMPNFDIADSDLCAGTTFQTEYLIWSNFGLEKEDVDLCAYQLSAEVLARLGYDDGVLTKLHQRRAEDADYQQTLELLEYDLLYGDRAAIGGAELQPSDLRMGTVPITLLGADTVRGDLFVAGKGFTVCSVVLLNGRPQDTLFVDRHNLLVPGLEPEAGDRVAVAQIGADGVQLSETEEYIIKSNREGTQ